MFEGIALKIASWFVGGGLQSLVGSAADAYKAKLANGTEADKLSADLAARQLQLDAKDAELQQQLTMQDKWYSPRSMMGYAVAFYLAKIYVWDKALHLGVTDALGDDLTWTMRTIIIAYFGARTVRDVVATFRAR